MQMRVHMRTHLQGQVHVSRPTDTYLSIQEQGRKQRNQQSTNTSTYRCSVFTSKHVCADMHTCMHVFVCAQRGYKQQKKALDLGRGVAGRCYSEGRNWAGTSRRTGTTIPRCLGVMSESTGLPLKGPCRADLKVGLGLIEATV